MGRTKGESFEILGSEEDTDPLEGLSTDKTNENLIEKVIRGEHGRKGSWPSKREASSLDEAGK
jgi:hypothetical protein